MSGHHSRSPAPWRRERLPRRLVTFPSSSSHWERIVYTTVIWGTSLDYQVETFFLGMCLQRTSTKRRIAFVAEDTMKHGLSALLGTVWELRTFNHLDLNMGGALCRLNKVWSKLQVWELLADELDVAVLLDTDLLVQHCMDPVFSLVQNAGIAATFRGLGDFPLTEPRRADTIKTAARVQGKGRGKKGAGKGGGINGGVIVFKPNHETYGAMRRRLSCCFLDGEQHASNIQAL